MKAASAMFGVLVFVATGCAHASGTDCIDAALDRRQLEACGIRVVTPKQERVDAEYKRLMRRYAGDEEMLELMRSARETWLGYINVHCLFEGAAAGGTTSKPVPLKGQKAFMRCIARVSDDAYAGLGRLR